MTLLICALLGLVVVPVIWLGFEAYRAPVASEGPEGFRVIEPGRRWEDLFLLHAPRSGLSSPLFWGLG